MKCVVLSTLDSFTPNNVQEHDIGNMESICAKCGALLFHDETHKKCNTICFKELTPFGVQISKSGSHPFQNLHFSFKIYYTVIVQGPTPLDSMFEHATQVLHLTREEYKFANPGPYCFRINGQVYHAISQLQTSSGEAPKFPQIYLYDGSEQVNAQSEIFKHLRTDVVNDLQVMIWDMNPYVKLY